MPEHRRKLHESELDVIIDKIIGLMAAEGLTLHDARRIIARLWDAVLSRIKVVSS